MVDDERNTFYHHHGCVEAQSLRLVNAYLADKGIDGHQQVLLTVVGTLRVIYAVDDDEAEIARNSVFAERRIGASQIHLPAGHQVFYHLSQIETHPKLNAETYAHGYTVEGVGNQSLATVLQCVRSISKFQIDKPVMVSTLGLLVDDGIEQLVIHRTFLLGMVHINQIGSVLGDALVGLDIGDNLIILIQRFGTDVMMADLDGADPYIHHQEQDSANKHRTPSSCEEF